MCADFSLCSKIMFAIICCFASVFDLHSAGWCRCTVDGDIFKPICPRSGLNCKSTGWFQRVKCERRRRVAHTLGNWLLSKVKSPKFWWEEYLQMNKFCFFQWERRSGCDLNRKTELISNTHHYFFHFSVSVAVLPLCPSLGFRLPNLKSVY